MPGFSRSGRVYFQYNGKSVAVIRNRNKSVKGDDREFKKRFFRLLDDPKVVERIRSALGSYPSQEARRTEGDLRTVLVVELDNNRVTLFLPGDRKPVSLNDPVQCLIVVLSFCGVGGNLAPQDWQERVNEIFNLCRKEKHPWRWLCSDTMCVYISEKMRQVRDKHWTRISESGSEVLKIK